MCPRSAASKRSGAALGLAAVLATGCSTQSNFLGFDRPLTVDTLTDSDGASSLPPPVLLEAGPDPIPPASTPSTTVTVMPTLDLDSGLGSCKTSNGSTSNGSTSCDTSCDTNDCATSLLDASVTNASSLDASKADAGDAGRRVLPNHFVDVVGVSPQEVDERIEATFQQLFHGDLSEQSIYYEADDDESYIYDRNHDDTRMDAIGYGLLIAVELDHRAEFDKIWAYAKNRLQFTMGAHTGYFADTCPTAGEGCSTEAGSMGTFFTATALFFAEARWGNGEGLFDYGAQAREILTTLLQIEERNGDVVDGITNSFNPETSLPQSAPSLEEREHVSPGIVWPAFFEIWNEKTDEAFWQTAAEQSRAYLNVAPSPDTGLYPQKTTSDGTVVEGFEIFEENTYLLWLSLALDHAWFGQHAGQVEAADRAITFFDGLGSGYPDSYIYTTGVVAPEAGPSGALVAMNGALAGIATLPAREGFIRKVWDAKTPEGYYRYFDGVTHLLSLMYLSGTLQPY